MLDVSRCVWRPAASGCRQHFDVCARPYPILQVQGLHACMEALAETVMTELDRRTDGAARAEQQQERHRWEARLTELDTVNAAHVEHLDRKFHDLNAWQQRMEGLIQSALLAYVPFASELSAASSLFLLVRCARAGTLALHQTQRVQVSVGA